MEEQLTDWFPAIVKPCYSGEYQVKRLCWSDSERKMVRRWHKLEWRNNAWHYTKRARMMYPGCLAGMCVGDFWRGLTSDSSKGK